MVWHWKRKHWVSASPKPVRKGENVSNIYVLKGWKEKRKSQEKDPTRDVQFIPGVCPVEDVSTVVIKLDKMASDNIISAYLSLSLRCNIVGATDPEDEVICNGRPMMTRGVTLVWIRVPWSNQRNNVGGSPLSCRLWWGFQLHSRQVVSCLVTP